VHPEKEDEAIYDKIWLEHAAGKDIYYYDILELQFSYYLCIILYHTYIVLALAAY